jgi:ferredoxin
MAYKISDACVACGACAEACPTDFFSKEKAAYEIDADKCVSCGACAEACPVEAPQEEA